MSDDPLCPRDHAEAVALFRTEVVGAFARRELMRGELASALRALAKLRRPASCARLATASRKPAFASPTATTPPSGAATSIASSASRLASPPPPLPRAGGI